MSYTRGGAAGAARGVLAQALCLAAALAAAAAAPARAQEGPSPEKAALIRELNEVTNSRGNAQAIMDSVVAETRRERARIFEVAIQELGDALSPAEREELMRKDREDSARLEERVMALFKQKVDLPGIVDEVSYVVYDRHFSAEELRDLLAFYRTPTGRKSITVMPRLFADSMAETSKRLLPRLEPIMRQVVEEERLRVESLIPPKPRPRPKAAPRRRRPAGRG